MIERRKKICKECKNEEFLFGRGMCAGCYKRLTYKPIVSKVRPNKVSKSQVVRSKEYSLLRGEFLASFPICQCCNNTKSTEIHHKAGRDGDNLFSHFLAVCRPCHIRIEENPLWAKENGFSISRLN